MSTFTITLGEIVESELPVFDPNNKYPIFDEAYRQGLEIKIINHYWLYEIGQETIQIFQFAMNRKMWEIMPYYNQLYESLIELDPLATMDYTDIANIHSTNDTTTNQTGTNSTESDAKSRAVTSDTPQVHLSGDEDYATSAADSITNTTGSGSTITDGSQNGTTDGNTARTVKGSQGHQAALLMQYRQSILNIDMNIIADLESLFMSLWDNGDEFAGGEMYYGWTYGWIGSL